MPPAAVVLSLLAAYAFAFAAPSPHDRRITVSAETIVADVNAIDTGVNDLRAEIAGYTGGLLSETALLGGFTEIEVSNRKGYVDANLASKFDISGSTQIVQSVVDTVANDIPAAIEELKGKKPLFEAAGQNDLVLSTLKVLLYDHDSFSAAVSSKLTADMNAGADAVAVIHDSIQGGIDYFST